MPSASIGSIDAARRAGARQAMTATASSTTVTLPRVAGSRQLSVTEVVQAFRPVCVTYVRVVASRLNHGQAAVRVGRSAELNAGLKGGFDESQYRCGRRDHLRQRARHHDLLVAWHSVLWAIIHRFFSWLYAIYYVLTRSKG